MDSVVIDFHCLLKGVDNIENINLFCLDNLNNYELDENIVEITDKYILFIYHPEAKVIENRNKILDYLANKMLKFYALIDEKPVSTEFHRVYNLIKIKDSIFLFRELKKGDMV